VDVTTTGLGEGGWGRGAGEMSEFFVTDGPPDESFPRIAEVFHLDEEISRNA
jgi:hypothetical protein